MVEVEGKPQVVVSATKRVRGYDLATGAQLWECAGLTDNVVSSPVYGGGLLIAGNSYYQQAMLAIRLAGAKGDITATDHVVWKLNRLSPYVSSPCSTTIRFMSFATTRMSFPGLILRPARPRGEPLRLDGISDFIFASPIGAARRIYVTGRDGATVVLRHDRENAILAVNRLSDSFSALPPRRIGEPRPGRKRSCIALRKRDYETSIRWRPASAGAKVARWIHLN